MAGRSLGLSEACLDLSCLEYYLRAAQDDWQESQGFFWKIFSPVDSPNFSGFSDKLYIANATERTIAR